MTDTLKQVNVRVDAQTLAQWDRLAGVHGGKVAALQAALNALDRPEGIPAAPAPIITEMDAPAVLRAAASEMESLRRLARFAKKA